MHARARFFTVVSTVGEFLAAKQRNFMQRSANLAWLRHLQLVRLRKEVKPIQKSVVELEIRSSIPRSQRRFSATFFDSSSIQIDLSL
jgi:hypothetical protein